jgi:aspartate aminotransferase
MAEQKATAAFLHQNEEIDRYLSDFREAVAVRLHRIYDGFRELKNEGFPVDAIAPQAAIYLTIKIDLTGKKKADGKKLEQQSDTTSYLLDRAGLAIVPFSAFGASKNSPWYRLSVGTCHLEDIDAMVRKLREAMGELS